MVDNSSTSSRPIGSAINTSVTKASTTKPSSTIAPVSIAIVTGGAVRIGAAIVRKLHETGFNVVIHCRSSFRQAQQLAAELNGIRSDSVSVFVADLACQSAIEELATACRQQGGEIKVLVNNASTFYAKAFDNTTRHDWQQLMASNMTAPYFLTQALLPELKKHNGCVINMLDIHARQPLKNHSAYCMAKAGLEMMTKALAVELAPSVRVNAVAPGAILWPSEQTGAGVDVSAAQQQLSDSAKKEIIEKIPMQAMGNVEDIANAVRYLVTDAPYVTGQVLTVDGGRSVAFGG